MLHTFLKIYRLARSPGWRKVRREHLKEFPDCIGCGGRKKLEVHHVVPVSVAPDLELARDNLRTLCESKRYGLNCHLVLGHNGDYSDMNPDVDMDAKRWFLKIRTRKK